MHVQPRGLIQIVRTTALLLAAVGLTACANAAPDATNSASPTSSTSSQTPTPSESPTAIASPTTDASTASCDFTPTREIFNPEDPENNGLFYVKLTNTASTGCQLSGYPDAAFVDSSGQAVGVRVSQLNDIPDQVVSVEPGGVAYVLIGFSGRGRYPSCDLVGADAIRIRLPQTGQEILTDVKDLGVCDPDTGGMLTFDIAPTKENVIS